MDPAIFLAKAWGLYMLIMSVILLINPEEIRRVFDATKEEGFGLFIGFFSLVIGILSLLFYSSWTKDWAVIITIFGWSALLKGVSYLLFPEAPRNWVKKLKKNPGLINGLLVVMAVLGLYLTYQGFFAPVL